jgi:hypothetical protein
MQLPFTASVKALQNPRIGSMHHPTNLPGVLIANTLILFEFNLRTDTVAFK